MNRKQRRQGLQPEVQTAKLGPSGSHIIAISTIPVIKPGEAWTGIVPWDCITPNPDQPRQYFSRVEQLKLLGSYSVVGQQHAISVIPFKDPKNEKVRFMIVDGERRWRALEGKLVRVEVNPEVNLKNLFISSFAANFCKEEHTVRETIQAVWRAVEVEKMNHGDVAKAVGWENVSTVHQYLRLHNLIPELQELMDPPTPKNKKLGIDLAMIIAKASADRQKELFERVKTGSSYSHCLHLARTAIDEVRVLGRRRKPSDDRKIVSSVLRRSRGGLAHLNSLGKEVLCCDKSKIWAEQIKEIVTALDRIHEIMTGRSLVASGTASVSEPMASPPIKPQAVTSVATTPVVKTDLVVAPKNGGPLKVSSANRPLIPLRPVSPPTTVHSTYRAIGKRPTPGQLLREIEEKFAREQAEDGADVPSPKQAISKSEEDRILAQFARTDARKQRRNTSS